MSVVSDLPDTFTASETLISQGESLSFDSVLEMTAEQYLAWEPLQQERHEFQEGKAVVMAGGTPQHNALCFDILYELAARLRQYQVGCEAYGSDQRVTIPGRDRFYYPDGMVVCGEPAFQGGILQNPTLILEVMSPSTERADRTDKFRDYQKIASLRYYLLVEQERVSVTLYERQESGIWNIAGDAVRRAESLRLTLAGQAISLPLAALYRRVPVPEAETIPEHAAETPE